MNEKTLKKTLYYCTIMLLVSLLFLGLNGLVISQGAISFYELLKGIVNLKSLVVVIAFVAIGFVVSIVGLDTVVKYRLLIVLSCFIVCVLLGITGSSVEYIHNFFGSNNTDVLFGRARGVRVDEWGTFTPMTWSQYYDPVGRFSYFSSVVRAEKTDVFLEYGQPVASLLMFYKPFFLGYLFLPISNGMSFFWCGRLLALFLVSFEFGRIITSKNNRLSCVYSFLITFAPVVQWWFAINGFVEMLIFFQLSLVFLERYIKTEKYVYRILYAAGITMSAGGYALTMYPAWMIPLTYLLLGIIIWIILENRKQFVIKKKDIIIWIICILVLSLSMAYVFWMSKDTIHAMMNTVYPGGRNEVGGGILNYFFNYVSNMWYSIKESSPYANVCEAAYFTTLFPLGYIMYFIYVGKKNTKDLLCSIIIGINIVLLFFCIFSLPGIVTKVTFLSQVTANRAVVIIGFSEVILLIRTISLYQQEKLVLSKVFICLASLGLTISTVWIAYTINKEYYSLKMLALEVGVFFCIILGCFVINSKIHKVWSVFVCTFMFLIGILVNPIDLGTKTVQNIPELTMIQEVVENDPNSVWIVENVGYPITNFPIMKGAKTVNSTNVYPDLDRWKMIDNEGTYEAVYNRYAHIQIMYSEEYEEKFTLNNPDYFTVYLNYDEMKKLGVKYIFTNRDLSFDDNITEVRCTGSYYVFEIK